MLNDSNGEEGCHCVNEIQTKHETIVKAPEGNQ